jgi:Chalcone isomerase-like
MTFIARCIAGLAGLMLSLGIHAATVELSGVKVADPVEVQGSKLALNGAGIRYKAIFKVYVAGLYLDQRAVTPEEVYAAPGAKRISITLLRDIDSNELGKNFTRGLEDNTPRSDMGKLIPALIRMSQIFSDQKKLLAGENFTIDWIPDTGTVLTVKGKAQGEPFKDIAFFNAMLRIWLGPLPADLKLKEALLGKVF